VGPCGFIDVKGAAQGVPLAEIGALFGETSEALPPADELRALRRELAASRWRTTF
jgi:hypothetical protein